MARTSQFLFTNVTDQSAGKTPKQLGLVSNYAVTDNTANEARLSNKTAPLDAEELISIRTGNLERVKSRLVNQYPASSQAGVQYSIQIEDMLVTTDSTDPDFRVDAPIIASLSVRHPKSAAIDNNVVATVVMRLLSACMHDNGSWRFEDFMRSAERPVAD
jgi:hypothetical protein